MHLSELQQKCFDESYASGWWKDIDWRDSNVCAVKIALMHSELSEALEGLRKDTMDDHLPHRKTFEVELADTIIRILDLAGARGMDIEGAILEKMAYNLKRADHKLSARSSVNGKRF